MAPQKNKSRANKDSRKDFAGEVMNAGRREEALRIVKLMESRNTESDKNETPAA